MAKFSTLHYSIHNLASQIKHELMSCDDLTLEKEFEDVIDFLKPAPVYDVRQEIVDNILNFAKTNKSIF